MTRTYANQFTSDYAPPAAVLAALAADGWVDTSWGNDVCPSWEKGPYRLYIEHPDKDQRESGGARFDVFHLEFSGIEQGLVCSSDDEEFFLKWLASAG